MSIGEELNVYHVIYGLVGTFYFYINLIDLSAYGFNNNSMVKNSCINYPDLASYTH